MSYAMCKSVKFAVPFELLESDIMFVTISIPYPSEIPGYAGRKGETESRITSSESVMVKTPMCDIVVLE